MSLFLFAVTVLLIGAMEHWGEFRVWESVFTPASTSVERQGSDGSLANCSPCMLYPPKLHASTSDLNECDVFAWQVIEDLSDPDLEESAVDLKRKRIETELHAE
ncbi:MAG: hypothetical protein J4F97_06400 [Pseudomonadales bacterium]|nr:hypothetical protein [Pseudomonadales bacterium]